MRWNRGQESGVSSQGRVCVHVPFRFARSSRFLRAFSGVAGTALVLLLLSVRAAEEKRLAVYSPQGTYWVSVVEREGKDYVKLTELLQPLGSLTAKWEGHKWKVRFQAAGQNEVEAEFRVGKRKAKVESKTVDLRSPFLAEGENGLAPVVGLGAMLSRMLPQVEFRENARRLFVGGTGTQFNAVLEGRAPPRLVLHFSARVNPQVATEPGRLRLLFTREPVIAAPGTQTFDDKVITSASYSESNGAAELTVRATEPLMATFGDAGETITIGPAPGAPVAALPPPVLPAPAPAPPSLPRAPEPAPRPARPRFLVVIDPGHGGEENGAMLSATLPEKEVTLAWARRLRAALEMQGITVILLRDTDVALSLEQRAVAANEAHPAVFITLHAASNGRGVRLYTARLRESPVPAGGLLPWNTAQAGFLPASRAVAAKVEEELAKRQVAVSTGSALLRPLTSVVTPAIALEVAPPGDKVEGLNSAAYQQSVCSAVAAAIAAVRGEEGRR
jgi:N-acetylmuramoyl-L-alanine amidase